MAVYEHIEHGFEPVFDEGCRVLVLGSLPSVLSRAHAFYYGNPKNRFWRMVAAVTGEPVPPNEGDALADRAPATLAQSIEAKRALLLRHGIALWDTIQSCDIQGSSDASIRNVVPTDLARVISRTPIEAVLCNGGTAGRLYRRYQRAAVGIDAVVLPSTSPANASWSLGRLVGRWGEVLGPLTR